MYEYTVILCFYAWAFATGDLNIKSEPQCYSRFDYEFKVVEKLAQIEKEQGELWKIVHDLEATKAEIRQPYTAFSAQLHADTADLALGTTVVFDDVTLNIGNCYDSQHGIFTTTQQGVYFFTMTLSSPTFAQMWILKNSEDYEYTFSHGTGWSTGSASVILQLNPGDRVWVEGKGVIHGFVSRNTKPHKTTFHSSFTGFLITTL